MELKLQPAQTHWTFCGSCGNDPGDAGGGGGSGSDSGSSADSGGTSTPFLYIKNASGQMVRVNDVLFGHPVTLHQSYKDGLSALKRGNAMTDAFKVPSEFVQTQDSFECQIREIEPEESFFESIELKAYSHPVETILFPSYDYQSTYCFQKDDLATSRISIEAIESFHYKQGSLRRQSLVPANFTFEKINTELHLVTGDFVEISTSPIDQSKPLYLSVDSYYRDWGLGNNVPFSFGDNIKINLSKFTSRSKTQIDAAVVSGLRSVVFAIGLVTSLFSVVFLGKSFMAKDFSLDGKDFSDYFGLQIAHADHSGKSLVVEVWNGLFYKKMGVIKPRSQVGNIDTIELDLSQCALTEDNKLRLRVHATKNHRVRAFSFHQATNLSDSVSVATYGLDQSSAKRISEMRNDDGLVHLVAGEKLDLKFSGISSHRPESITTFLFTCRGFYTPLSEEGATRAGSWYEKMESSDKKWLRALASHR